MIYRGSSVLDEAPTDGNTVCQAHGSVFNLHEYFSFNENQNGEDDIQSGYLSTFDTGCTLP